MKYKNIETLAKKVAKRLYTNVKSVFHHDNCDLVWFDNAFIMCVSLDDTWFTITDYSDVNESKNVMKCYLADYGTQKRFFEDMEEYVNTYRESTETTEQKTTETTEQETVEPTEQEPETTNLFTNEDLAKRGYFRTGIGLIERLPGTKAVHNINLDIAIYKCNVAIKKSIYKSVRMGRPQLLVPNVRSIASLQTYIRETSNEKFYNYLEVKSSIRRAKRHNKFNEVDNILYDLMRLLSHFQAISDFDNFLWMKAVDAYANWF